MIESPVIAGFRLVDKAELHLDYDDVYFALPIFLDDEIVYPRATLSVIARDLGMIDQHGAGLLVMLLSDIVEPSGFPMGGDQVIPIEGFGPIPGWKGLRWRLALEHQLRINAWQRFNYSKSYTGFGNNDEEKKRTTFSIQADH